MTRYIVNPINTWPLVTLNFFGEAYLNIFSILPTGHIVIGFRRTLKMCPIVFPLGTLESDGWAHSKCTQHVPTGHIWVT